jgi:hypothetical protein
VARGGAGHARDGARGSVAIEFHEAVACLATAGTPHERAAAISTSYATNASDANDDSYSSYAASFAGHGHLMREANQHAISYVSSAEHGHLMREAISCHQMEIIWLSEAS